MRKRSNTLFRLVLFVALTGCSGMPSGIEFLTQSKIIGGSAYSGLPAIGMITINPNIEPFCTGTLIQPNVVITQAHCIFAANSNSTAGELTPLSGGSSHYSRTDLAFDVTADGTVSNDFYPSASVYVNPNYLTQYETAYEARYFDVALVVLQQSLSIPVIPLDTRFSQTNGLDTEIGVGNSVSLVGFGNDDDNHDGSRVKREVDTTYDGTVFAPQLEPTWILAGQTGQDTCFGDSGSPLIYFRTDGTAVDSGVLLGANGGGYCDQNPNTIYNPLTSSSFGPWINAALFSNHSSLPPYFAPHILAQIVAASL